MSRLIDVDLLEEILDVNIQKLQDEIDDARTKVQKVVYEAQLFTAKEIVEVIKNQPTAYNVDKVLEKFDMYKDMYKRDIANHYIYYGRSSLGKLRLIEHLEKIVKAGGLDE